MIWMILVEFTDLNDFSVLKHNFAYVCLASPDRFWAKKQNDVKFTPDAATLTLHD